MAALCGYVFDYDAGLGVNGQGCILKLLPLAQAAFSEEVDTLNLQRQDWQDYGSKCKRGKGVVSWPGAKPLKGFAIDLVAQVSHHWLTL